MTVRFTFIPGSGSADTPLRVEHPGSTVLWEATFDGYFGYVYTPEEPYERSRLEITHESVAASAEASARKRGMVPFSELRGAAREHWLDMCPHGPL